jgi:single-strand DNA-binding protein
MMNQVALVGRITKDPSFVGTGATPRCNFSVAVDRPYMKDKEKQTDFFDCVAWGKTAEFVGKYLEKGRLVAVTGRIEINVVQAMDGSQKRFTNIVVANVSPLTKGNREDAPTGGGAPVDVSDIEDPFA